MTNTKPWFVYILRCGDDSLYTGITTNVDRRVNEHQRQGPKAAKYVRGRSPVHLAYSESARDRSEASKREAEIKKLNKREKEHLIRSNASTYSGVIPTP